MKVEIKIPAMGESISEATVSQILKPSGSQVAMDDEILELETEKVNQVLYAPQPGVVTWNVSAGDVVKIGQIIGYLDSEAKIETAAAPKQEPAKETAVPPPPPSAPKPESKAPTAQVRLTKEAFISEVASAPKKSPAEPKLAPAKPVSSPSKPGERREIRRKMSKIRQVIARRLVEAQQTTAMLTTFNEIDMSQVIALREKYKEAFVKEYGVRLGFMSFFVKAAVAALQELPDLNSYMDGDEIVQREYFDIGIAVSTDRGLIVPVLRNCDQLSFAEIESSIEAYAKKAREGGLTMDDLQGGGFTITNGGVYGSLLSTPILNPPQPGILGMHKIMKRPVVVDDQITIRSMMYVALSYDHRLVDGKEAVTFLVAIKNYLEDPARLTLHI